MNYLKHYTILIERAKNRSLECYTEQHHILPRCLNGSNAANNLVRLTPEEHYIAHQLLVKIYPSEYSLVKAANMMASIRPGNKLYGWLRRRLSSAMSDSQSGSGNSQYGSFWITNGTENLKLRLTDEIPHGFIRGRYFADPLSKEKRDHVTNCLKGRRLSAETKCKISKSSQGRKHTEATKEKLRNIVVSTETKQRLSSKAKQRKKETCPHCGETTTINNIIRWHNDNCKHKMLE